MSQTPIWPGSGSAIVGNTPFGFYDSDTDFQADGPNFAIWSARRLGYPIVDIELQDINFYAVFEEATTEYGAQVNQFNIKDNLFHLQGQSTGSNLSGQVVTPTLGRLIFISQQYGTEVGAGGFVDWKEGYINVNSGSQEYDLNVLYADVSESGAAIEIKRIFHEATPAINRYFDPYAGTGAGAYNMLDGFGWGQMSPAVQFQMMPIYADMLRVQAIELNDQVRKSAYSFELVNNKLRIHPKPVSTFKAYFQYILTADRDNALIVTYGDSPGSSISDMSNAPYDNMVYEYINDVGKQWIKKYGLALSKEILGMVRSKYSSIPIPNADTSLDGETLRSEAATEKESLISELRDILDQMSRKALLENEKDEADFMQEKLSKIPMQIYMG